MTRKRKTVTMIVEVTAEAGTSNAIADVARNHVRVAIQDGLAAQGMGTKLKSVKPAGRIIEAARMADQAWGVAKAVRAKPPKPGPVTPLLEAMGEK